MITDTLQVPVATFETETGWELKPQGACQGDRCVPLPAGAVNDGIADLTAIAERLRMPVVHDEQRGLYALGPESSGGHVFAGAEAPELVLPAIAGPTGEGDQFRLSSLRGSKVLLVAWAPY